eukprot:sb/3479088/
MLHNQQYDEFVDIWCVGILVYEFLVGKAPFELESTHATLENIKTCKYEIPEYVNREAADLISKILVVDAKLRPTLSDILSHPWIVKNAQSSIKLPG